MRLYAILEYNIEEDILEPVTISLNSFEDNCYFIDLEDSKQYDIIVNEENLGNWKPYNTTLNLGNYVYNPNTKEFIKNKVISVSWDDFKLENGEVIEFDDPKYEGFDCYVMYQDYKNGVPIGELYFEEY